MADYQRIMDYIESYNIEIEKRSNEIEGKRSLVKIKMAITESRQEYQ